MKKIFLILVFTVLTFAVDTPDCPVVYASDGVEMELFQKEITFEFKKQKWTQHPNWYSHDKVKVWAGTKTIPFETEKHLLINHSYFTYDVELIGNYNWDYDEPTHQSFYDFYRGHMYCKYGQPCHSPDEHLDESGECVESCPRGLEWSKSNNLCVCPDGKVTDEYDLTTGKPLTCKDAPTSVCPPSTLDASGKKVLSLISSCNSVSSCSAILFGFSDTAILPVGMYNLYCAYGIKDDNSSNPNDDKCGVNEIEIDGNCYPMKHDDNKTDGKEHNCPVGEYYSFEKDGCVPFFDDPDDNSSDNGSNDSDDSSGGTSSGDANGSINAPGVGDFEKAISPFLDKGKDVIDSYVLVDIPIRTSGGNCISSLKEDINILGHHYTIDLTPYMSQVDKSLSWIKPLVIFMFGFSAVIIVLSNKD